MPRVPTVRTTAGRIPFASQAQPEQTVATGQSVANVFRQAAGVAAEFEARDRNAKRKQFEAIGLSELTTALGELQLEAANDPNITGSAARFSEGATAALDGIAGRFDGDTAAAIRVRGVQLIATGGVTAANTERIRFNASAVVAMENLTDNYAVAVASATTDLAREQGIAGALSAIVQSDFLTAAKKDELVERFHAGVAGAIEQQESDSVTVLIEDALANPGTATASLAQASVLLDERFTPNIDAKDRLTLRRSIKTAQDATETRIREADRAAGLAAEDFFVAAFNSEDPDAVTPTIAQIVDSPMTRIAKEHFIAIAEKDAKGEDMFKGIPAVEAALFARIHDPNSPNPITEPEELLPFLKPGGGLGTERFSTMKADIVRKNAPATRRAERQFSDFLSRSKAKMVTASLVANSDPIGLQSYNDFTLVADRMWLDGLAAGKTPEQLLRSDSPDYIGKIIPQFQKGLAEKSRGAFSSLFKTGLSEPPTAFKSVRRKPDELPQDWIDRVGLQQ